MALESLGDFVRKPQSGNSFSQIYRAHLLQEKMTELLGPGVTVTLRGQQVRLWCQSEALAVLARLKKTKILALCHRSLGQSDIRLVIKLKLAKDR